MVAAGVFLIARVYPLMAATPSTVATAPGLRAMADTVAKPARSGEAREASRLTVADPIRVEVVDLFHFLISMAQVLGMSADDVFNAYVKKNAVNFQRQDAGYAVKDHDDSKHI